VRTESVRSAEAPLIARPTDGAGCMDAIELTCRVIRDRAARYRRLALSAVAICAASLVWAVVAAEWRALLGGLLLFPLSALFFQRDAALMAHWQGVLMDTWAHEALELGAFRETLERVPAMPANTVREMLEFLSRSCGSDHVPRLARPTRRALVLAANFRLERASDQRVATTVARLGAVALAAMAVLWGSWWPVSGTVLLPLPLAIARRIGGHRRRILKARLAELSREGCDLRSVLEVARQGQCGSANESGAHELIAAVLSLAPEAA
jgi:hypothetical protein